MNTRTWVVLALLLATAGSAGAGESLDEVCQIASSFRDIISRFVYPIGAVGLALTAIKAYQGHFPWSPVIAILGGLFAFASTPEILAFLTAGQGSVSCP